MRGATTLALPHDWARQDALYFTATGPDGREIYTWSWMIASADKVAQRLLAARPAPSAVATATSATTATSAAATAVTFAELADSFQLQTAAVSAVIDKKTGYLRELKKGATLVPLSNGPRLVDGSATLKSIVARRDGNDVVVQADYTGNLRKVVWRLGATGTLSVNYAYHMEGKQVDALGVTFDYPDAQVEGVRWLGKGPYRVWKNRTQGVEIVEAVFQEHAPLAVWRWSDETAPFMAAAGMRSYCCQYRESDLDFVTRLLTEEGLAWRVEDTDDGHRVVLFANSSEASATPEDASNAAGGGIRFHGAR